MLDNPILVGVGENDRSVPVESAEYLSDKFRETGKDNLRLRIYPGASHILQGERTSFRPAFFEELSSIIKHENLRTIP